MLRESPREFLRLCGPFECHIYISTPPHKSSVLLASAKTANDAGELITACFLPVPPLSIAIPLSIDSANSSANFDATAAMPVAVPTAVDPDGEVEATQNPMDAVLCMDAVLGEESVLKEEDALREAEPSPSEDSSSFVADSLAIGMAVMLAMTIIQRGLGFFRGLWFCRQLDDVVVGQWSMAYDFITLITPVLLLGLPGSLPRYVEHYRVRGQLGPFSKKILQATVALAVIGMTGILIAPDWIGWIVFLNPQNRGLVYCVGVAMMSIVAFNYIYQLVSSLRQVRVASVMQFIQSIVFTFVAISWLSLGGGINGIVYSFVVATLVATVPGMWSLQRGWRGLKVDDRPFDAPKMWRRLLPYAAALWMMNLLTNTFTLSDRYMILHLMPGGDEVTQGAVGQYHSGRIIPMLLVSIASMISGVLMPYLTADWEAGNRNLVSEKVKRILFAMSIVFTAGATVAILFSPWLFETLLENRYTDGLTLMPMAFVFCIWMSIGYVGQDYLWVAERGKWVAVALAVGFAVNIGLNFALLPVLGLQGAVLATLISNGIVLLGVFIAMWRWGYSIDASAMVTAALPLALLTNPLVAGGAVILACLGTRQTRGWCVEGVAVLKAKFAGIV